MNIGPDGSLPRITSSSKGIVPCVKIVKVPDDQVKESGLFYKLVWIGPTENESDSNLSDKSDEELWSDEDVQALPVDNKEDGDTVKRGESKTNANEQQSEQIVEHHNINRNNRHRKNTYKNNYNSGQRNFKASNRLDYDKSASSTIEENNHFFSNKRNFGNKRNNFGRKQYQKPPAKDIDPWIRPSQPPPPPSVLHYGVYNSSMGPPYMPLTVMEQTPPPPADNKSMGLLGDSPYFRNEFPINSQMHSRNRWNEADYRSADAEYDEYPSPDFQRSGSNRPRMPRPQNRNNYYSRNERRFQRGRNDRNWPPNGRGANTYRN